MAHCLNGCIALWAEERMERPFRRMWYGSVSAVHENGNGVHTML